MKVTSLTYTRSAKVADPVNRYENHDVSLSATVQGEWDDDSKVDSAMVELKEWVLKHVHGEVKAIRDGG